MEAAGRGEHGPLPQPVTSLQLSFSHQLHPPPQRGPARPPDQGLPLSDQRQPDLLQLFSKRTSSPRDWGSSWRKIPASPGGVNIYTTWCGGRGKAEEVAGTRWH